ncbi:MAG: hypothetical protein AAF202_01140 [Pseudomonadota bacterium]
MKTHLLIHSAILTVLAIGSSMALAQNNFEGLLHQGLYQPEIHGTAEDLRQDAYVYQVQRMSRVNWLYIGFAPRQEDPSKIRVVFSKRAKTMRVEMYLTRADLAEYPGYLVKRARRVQRLIDENSSDDGRGIEFYQPWRLQNFYATTVEISQRYGIEPDYNNITFEQGYEILKERFPTNVFKTQGYRDDNSPDDIAAVAHFVYPISTYKFGISWPPDKTYMIKDVYGPESVQWTVEERRSYHRIRNDEGEVVRTDHIFSGWPAFWIDGSGAGTGVHGPIRYAKLNELGNSKQRAPYGNSPSNMLKFWRENEFRRDPVNMTNGIEEISYRWDVVRTSNSLGCFRAETLELRHLLPADPMAIFNDVTWDVQTDVDTIQLGNDTKYVDVNYYMVNPFAFPLERERWVSREIDIDTQEFLDNAYLFEYLDPATLEFNLKGQSQKELMGKFNRAGSKFEQAELDEIARLGRVRPVLRPEPKPQPPVSSDPQVFEGLEWQDEFDVEAHELPPPLDLTPNSSFESQQQELPPLDFYDQEIEVMPLPPLELKPEITEI